MTNWVIKYKESKSNFVLLKPLTNSVTILAIPRKENNIIEIVNPNCGLSIVNLLLIYSKETLTPIKKNIIFINPSINRKYFISTAKYLWIKYMANVPINGKT